MSRTPEMIDAYEDFHVARTAIEREYRGRGAKEAIVDRLAGRTRAQVFASSVCDFYGDSLRFHESCVLPSSLYEIKFRHDPVGLRYVLVKLQLGTRRTAESLSHEILHIRLGMCGYPLPDRVFIPRGLVPHARHLMGIQSIVHNLLQHELIFDEFCRLGFQGSAFLADLAPAPRYEEAAAMSSPSLTSAGAVQFPWWCLEYFRHWLSARHGLGGVASTCADRALYWGSKVYPSLKEAARQMTRLIDSGAVTNHGQYPGWVNRLLRVMRLPGYSEWVIVEAGSDRGPSVLRWDSEGSKIVPGCVRDLS